MRNSYQPYARCLMIGALAICAARHAGAGSILSNGGFEAGGGSFNAWTVATQAGSFGGWYVQSGSSSPLNGFTVPLPPQGAYAAMTDSDGIGSQALLQSFTVPVGATSVILSFQYFLLIPNSEVQFLALDSLDYTDTGNEQARVDILNESAAAFDLGAAVVENLMLTNQGDSSQYDSYQTFSRDITSAVTPGTTYQLRFAEVDSQGFLLFGVDDVAISTTTVPEPGSALAAFTGIGAIAWWKRRIFRTVGRRSQ